MSNHDDLLKSVVRWIDRGIAYLDWDDTQAWPANDVRDEWRTRRRELRGELHANRNAIMHLGSRMKFETLETLNMKMFKLSDRIADSVNEMIVSSRTDGLGPKDFRIFPKVPAFMPDEEPRAARRRTSLPALVYRHGQM